MDIKRNGTRPSGKGPADWFTGTVRIDPLFEAPAPARVFGGQRYVSRAPAPHGIPIRWVRHWSLHPVSDGCSGGAVPRRKSGRAT